MFIVSDSGPILSFARAHYLDLLQRVVHELIIPGIIYQEIVVRGKEKPGAEKVREGSWIKCKHIRDRAFVEELPQKLHLGEREALALAKELGAVLLVDEREARNEARRLGIDHIGSLLILKEAKEQEFMPTIKPILDELIATGTYISDTLYQSFLEEIGEV